MRKINFAALLIGSLIFIFQPGNARSAVNELMPVPEQVKVGNGKYRIDDSFRTEISGESGLRLIKAVSRMVSRLGGRTGFFLPQAFPAENEKADNPNMIIKAERAGKIALGEDESYQLEINSDGIVLNAETDIGVIRGLETFLQLLSSDEKGYYFPFVVIKDRPRFPWRGLLIDVGRHFIPAHIIKRNLDGMAMAKMNVLHLHLTEDQGFRIECRTFPKLHELGSDGQYYTQEEIKDIIQYAADRGIRVMPEFDLPGHSTSWLVGYPELASAPGPYKVEREWGIKDPAFNPANEETYRFLDAFFKEMSALFPDEYIHIGGDENNGKQWDANEDIQSFMKKNGIKSNHELQSYFNNRILKIFTKYGKKMVGWEEILHSEMPKTIVIQSWRGRESMTKAAKEGYQAILSNGYYIDHIHSAEYHYLNDPLSDDMNLTEKQRKLILGGEAAMWGESVNYETIDSRIWPRTAAIAERFWSSVDVKDIDDMYRRLKIFSFHLEELSLTHEKNLPYFLRRLTNDAPIQPLRNLIDIVEPVKGLKRGEIILEFSYTPMTRTVDAARPDAETAMIFRKMVAAYLKGGAADKDLEKKITDLLALWKDNHAKLLPIIKASPILWEVESLSADASACGRIGLDAIEKINDGTAVSQEWFVDRWSVLHKAELPRGDTELMIVSAVKALLKYVYPEYSKEKGDNTLSALEIAEGWKLLFDGKSAEQWRAAGGDSFPKTWEVVDGTLHCKGAEKGAGQGGEDLLTEKKYSYFKISLDWKISRGGNSGVFYLCKEGDGIPLEKENFQMQIIDNKEAAHAGDENRTAGSLWDIIPADPQNARPAGEWNSITILVRGNGQKIHKQNGENVVEYYAGQSWYAPHWKKMVDNSSFKGIEHIINPEVDGYIGLQGGSEVWFKNIKICEIDRFR
jgi:hexosaminidase